MILVKGVQINKQKSFQHFNIFKILINSVLCFVLENLFVCE